MAGEASCGSTSRSESKKPCVPEEIAPSESRYGDIKRGGRVPRAFSVLKMGRIGILKTGTSSEEIRVRT